MSHKAIERVSILGVCGVTLTLCALILFVPVQGSGGHGDEHGHGEEHGDEHEESGLAVELDDDVIASAGMVIEKAAPVQLHPGITSRGQITEDANRAMNVKPRFSGIVRSVAHDFGDKVRRGDVLMVIESAATRSAYSIRTAIDGIIADKRVVSGSFVPEGESVLRVVDLSSVWFRGRISIKDTSKVKAGSTATVRDGVQKIERKGRVVFISPSIDEDTQTRDVRIAIDNKDGAWRIGSFAEARIEMAPLDVPVAVKSSSIQELNGQSVVFKRDEGHLIATPVKIGWFDQEWSEILTGLGSGDGYVSTNSFVAKAELLKSSAGHEH